MKILKDTSKKYERKINDNLITSNQISYEKDKQQQIQLTTQAKNKLPHNIPNYVSTNNKQQINGYQYTKKYYKSKRKKEKIYDRINRCK